MSLLVAAALAVAACSPKNAAPFPDVTSFCTAKAQAECQITSACGLPSATDCETAREALCNADANAAAQTGSHTRVYTQANAPKCIEAVNSVFGNGATKIAYAQLFGPGSVDDICERVFQGNAGNNQPCQSSYDCTDDNICVPVLPGSTSLVCATMTTVAAGAFCQNPGSTCATDTYCGSMSANSGYTCLASMQEGQSCVTAPCVGADRCEATGTTGETCEPRVPQAGACSTSDDCASPASYCDPYVGNQCELGLSFATDAPDCLGFVAGGSETADGGAGPIVSGTDAGTSDAAQDH